MASSSTETSSTSSAEVRAKLVEALKLDLVGPWNYHLLAEEKLPRWVRPSNWYLTGFLIPSEAAPDKSADDDEDDDFELVPESAGLAEESNDERKAAKKGFFPSSIGLSFLLPKDAEALSVSVAWGDYSQTEIKDEDEKSVKVWQRRSREKSLPIPLPHDGGPIVHNVPESDGLQVQVVARGIISRRRFRAARHSSRHRESGWDFNPRRSETRCRVPLNFSAPSPSRKPKTSTVI